MSRKNHNTEQSPYMEYGVQKEQKKKMQHLNDLKEMQSVSIIRF